MIEILTDRTYEEAIIDNFAGGGGATVGIEDALQRPVDYAINHDAEAIAMHKANHPYTQHLTEDVWQVDPLALLRGRPIGFGWFSPDCTYHSKARGGKPFRDKNVARRLRGLAWVVVKYAKLPKHQRPRMFFLENVEEFSEWGPLLEDGTRCPDRKGFTFRRWWRQLENLGYTMEMRELVACDYGVPTSRKRLVIIGRCDGEPIVWPKAMFGPSLRPYRTAAECVDWWRPVPSIFMTPAEAREWARYYGGRPPQRPLAEATLRRIYRGIMRYVINNPRPFIVPLTHQGSDRIHGIDEPFRTITSAHRGELALAAPTLIKYYGTDQNPQLREPLHSITGQGNKHALVAAFLARHYGGHENDGQPLPRPFHTITSKDHHALITAQVQRDFGASVGHAADVPSGGGGKAALVNAFLIKYYGTDQNPKMMEPLHTVRTKDCFGLVNVSMVNAMGEQYDEQYQISDIGMRIFVPRELYRAQGFPEDYIIDPLVTRTIRNREVTKPLTQTAQVRMCGNSVPPPVAREVVAANYTERCRRAA